MGTWSSNAPSGVTFSSTTKKTDDKIWNYYSAYHMNVWTARGSGNTYYVKVTVNWKEGQNGTYQKENNGIWWYVGSDKQNFAMPSSMTSQTKYYTGTKGSAGAVTVGVSPNSNLSNSAEVTSASIPAATYAVKYKGNGADSGSTADQTKTYGTNLTLRSNGFGRTGYSFTGWNTAANGSGTSYAEGATYTNNAALTLYAQWAVDFSLELSSGNVYTPGTQVATIINGSGKTATVTITDGNSHTLFSGTTTTGTVSASVTKAWFETAGVTTATSFTATVTAVIEGSTLTDTFTVSAGADMFPDVKTPTITPVNAEPAATYYPNTLIASISRLAVAVEVDAPTSADIYSVSLQVGSEIISMTYNNVTEKWEGTTTAAVTVGTSYEIFAVDDRGLYSNLAAQIMGIIPYSPPVATVDTNYTYRCENDGTKKIDGAYYKAQATATCSQITGNVIQEFTVKIQGELTATSLTSGVQSAVLGGSMSSGQAYTLVFTIKDKVSTAQEFYYILKAPTKAITVHHDSNGTTVDLPEGGQYMIGGVSMVDIIYPVGSIYLSVSSTSPATLFGGTWAQIEDVFLLAAGQTYTAGDTGGEATHTLDITEIPSHTHDIRRYSGNGSSTGNSLSVTSQKYVADDTYGAFAAGGGGAHNNMPPYLVVYAWKRTA